LWEYYTKEDVDRLLQDSSVTKFAVPVCFGGKGGMHWTCIIFDKQSKAAIMYDSLNNAAYMKAMVSLVDGVNKDVVDVGLAPIYLPSFPHTDSI
jgi:hypothetical protein